MVLGVSILGACSVDDGVLELQEETNMELNATYLASGCTITTFNLGERGKVEIRNDRDYLYVTIKAIGENTLSSTSLHLADSFSGFPTVGKGNLQPEKMSIQQTYTSGENQYSFQFPLNDVPSSMVIASYTTFASGDSYWAGDVAVKQGNWSYFNYVLKEHPYNAGPDNTRTMTESEAVALPSWDEVRKVYAGMLAAGVDKTSGTYSPTIWEIINDFNDPSRASRLGDYTTTYTLGSGDCTDSVELTLTIVEDVTAN